MASHPLTADPSSTTTGIDVSVLVPARNEEGNVERFMELAAEAFAGSPYRYEVIVIDDGSTDGTWSVLRRLEDRYPFLRLARHRASRGIADALRTGYLAARGNVLVFYPADLQFMPEDIPRLTAPILAGDADMVTGFKEGKYEKAFVSKIYNGLSRTLFHVPVKDLNSVKAYRRDIMDALPIRPDWHRYMIVIAAAQGFTVTEIPVPLYPRHSGKSKFGISRIPVGVLDMLSVWFELRFGQKPLLLFGMLGFALVALSVVASAVLLLAHAGVRSIWVLIETVLILGSILFATGILGEQIAGQRAQLREIRRQLDQLAAERMRDR
jgi:glycosyltransferase involved in cell wall biosynthesis